MRFIFKTLFTALAFTTCTFSARAQDELLQELSTGQEDKGYIGQAFKGSRLVNGHSVETTSAGTLEFIFSHRFGRVNGGLYELFGLDDAFVRIGLEYGLTDNLSVGIGRNSVDKTVDSYLKYKLLRQTKEGVPFTITAFGSGAYKTSPKDDETPVGFETIDRLSYTGQLLIARRFTSKLSLQLMPTVVHKNYIGLSEGDSENTQAAIGIGGRIKLTRSVSVNAEYYYRLNAADNSPYKDAIGLAIDIETGGHVFQIVMTNTRGMIERTFITETDGDFFDGDIHLGFNVTRAFQLKSHKGK